jgi:hypothetical protein
VGVTFGATEDPTGAVWVGDRFGATEGGLVTPGDPPRDGASAGAVVVDAPPVEDPPEDEPPDEDPPEDDPACENAVTGISSTAATIRARMNVLLQESIQISLKTQRIQAQLFPCPDRIALRDFSPGGWFCRTVF